MKKQLSWRLVLIFLIAALMFAGAQSVYAETQSSSISFSAPTEGETLSAGKSYEIKFSLGITSIAAALYYSTDGGSNWNHIANLQFTDSSYNWTVPSITTSHAMLKITLSTLESSGMGFVTKTYYNTSDEFKISNLIVIDPIIIDPILLTPLAPTSLAAEAASSTQIDLTWNDNALNEGSYIVERQKKGTFLYTKVATLPANTETYSDSGLTAGTKYYYRVYASNGFGNSSYSNVDEATTFFLIIPLSPAPPSGLKITNTETTKVEIEWQDNSNNETGFKIERKLGSSAYEEIGSVGAGITAYEDTGLLGGTTYTYQVRSYNGFGNSDYSNSIMAETKIDIVTLNEGETLMRFYINSSDYYVNNKIMSMDASPVIKDSRTILPIRYVAEPLGASVAWNSLDKKVTITLGSKVIMLWINNNTANVNGIDVLIDPTNSNVKPIILPPGRTMLPLRFIAETLGCQVDWNPGPKEVTVSYSQP